MLDKLKFLIGWPLSLLALVFVFRIIYTNASDAIKSITEINYFLLLIAIILFVIFFFFKSYSWKLLLGKKGKQFSFKENAYLLAMSELKRYVPGNIWGFMARTAAFEREDLTKKEVLGLIVKETVLLSLASFLLSLIYILNFEQDTLLRNLALSLGIVSVFIFLMHEKISQLLGSRLKKIFYILVPDYSFSENLNILLWSVLTFFIFGLGTYFSISSIFYLDLRQILILIGIFNLSFFIGYISFITPMGLGVREGTMTLALTSFIGASASAISSVFTRVIFIISEMLVLAIILAWNKLKLEYIERIENFLVKNKTMVILSLFVLLYIFYYTTASFLRFDNFYTGRFDLGNMDQTIWNTIHGRFFLFTNPDGTETVSRLAYHSDFILVLLSPLYLIWENPKILLLLQTVVLGIGAYFVFAISKKLLNNDVFSLILSFAYLINPSVGFVNLYDFHAVALATTFLLASYYFFLTRKYYLLALFIFLAAITKEQVWTLVSIFGAFIVSRAYMEKKLKASFEVIYGLILLFIGIPISYLLIDKIIPYFRGNEHFALEFYSDLGSSASEIIKNSILNPLGVIERIFELERIEFLSKLLLPLGFLSLLSPLILVFAAPDLLISILSNNPALHQIYYQYTAVITPFIFIAAMYSVRFLRNKFNISFKAISLYILFFAILGQYLTGPLPGSKRPNIDMFTKHLNNKEQIDKFLSSIPKEARVAATNNAGSHLTQREHIYTLPIGEKEADYLIYLLRHGWSVNADKEQKAIERLKNDPNFELIYQLDNFFAFKRI
jgi:uncharacterized membrane protein/uncharacterized membrane protein YbhN (UPF0104 family)